MPAGLQLAVVSDRHEVNDVIIAREKGVTIDSLRENAVVATGSLNAASF